MTPEQQRSVLLLIDSATSAGVQRLENKIRYWVGDIAETKPNLNANWQRSGALDERQIPQLLKRVDFTNVGLRTKTLLSVAAELVWGREVPPQTRTRKRQILKGQRQGNSLTDLENLLLTLVCVDTDMF